MLRGLSDGVRRAAAAAADATAGTRAFRAMARSTPSTGSAASAMPAPPPAVHTARRHQNKATRPDNIAPAELPLIANMIVERIPIAIPREEKWEEDYKEW